MSESVHAGSQNNLGMDGSWQLLFSHDGSFPEGFQGEEIANCGGYDGEESVWDIDTAGRVSLLDLDDREVSNNKRITM